MAELGIDIGGHASKSVNSLGDRGWDVVVTACEEACERCPVLPGGAQRLHWSFPDPSRAAGSEQERLAVFRGVRDAIRAHLIDWVAGPGASSWRALSVVAGVPAAGGGAVPVVGPGLPPPASSAVRLKAI